MESNKLKFIQNVIDYFTFEQQRILKQKESIQSEQKVMLDTCVAFATIFLTFSMLIATFLAINAQSLTLATETQLKTIDHLVGIISNPFMSDNQTGERLISEANMSLELSKLATSQYVSGIDTVRNVLLAVLLVVVVLFIFIGLLLYYYQKRLSENDDKLSIILKILLSLHSLKIEYTTWGAECVMLKKHLTDYAKNTGPLFVILETNLAIPTKLPKISINKAQSQIRSNKRSVGKIATKSPRNIK